MADKMLRCTYCRYSIVGADTDLKLGDTKCDAECRNKICRVSAILCCVPQLREHSEDTTSQYEPENVKITRVTNYITG